MNLKDESVQQKSPRVLVVTASIGAGHNQVAKAVVEGLQAAEPQVAVECVDIMAYTPGLFRAFYAGGFALAMSRFPRLYGWGFRLSNRPQRPGRSRGERLRLAQEWLAARRFQDYLLQSRPDLVVSTHFLCPPVIERLVRQGRIAVRQMVTVTDIETHRRWYCTNVDRWFVPNDYTAGIFRRWGIPDEAMTVSGIPVRAKWIAPLDRDRILADWNLPADRKIVVLAGGADFTCGPVMRIARGLLAACPQLCLVVLAGRSKKLLASLASLPEAGARLHPVAFTDRAHELVEVSSIMVTKAGGITTAECLAKGKPMVFIRPVPGHEAGNAEYFAREGAAVITRRPEQIVQAVSRLLDDPQELSALADNAHRLYRPATETIVQAIRSALSS